MITFTIPAVPIAQPRQRSRVMMINGRAMAQNYTPTKAPVNAFKATCQMAFAAAHSGPPLAHPLAVKLTFVMPRPKSEIRKRGTNPRYWHIKKPDFDNLAKSVTDALTGLAWNDDSQLAIVNIAKVVASADEQPCVQVEIVEMTCLQPEQAL